MRKGGDSVSLLSFRFWILCLAVTSLPFISTFEAEPVTQAEKSDQYYIELIAKGIINPLTLIRKETEIRDLLTKRNSSAALPRFRVGSPA